MSWRESLIKIANHEVDTLQKRLTEVVDRREAAEMRVMMLDAQVESELGQIGGDPHLAFSRGAYVAGMKLRREQLVAQAQAIALEEAGARDALSAAFESQKKFEHVAELARLSREKAEAARENASLDEMGRRAVARR